MKKIKIIFLLNHFTYSDGVAKALIGLCNNLDFQKYDITILPIYKLDKNLTNELNERIHVKKGFGFYFRGMDKIVMQMPVDVLYRKFVDGQYNIEVGFQCGISTKIIGYMKRPNVQQILWMHGYKTYPQYFKNVDKVVCVSQYCNKKAVKELGNSKNITYCYNLLDDKKIKKLAEESVEIPECRGVRFVTVGRLSPEKGYDRLIRSMYKLKNNGYEFELLIIGNGSEYKKLSELIKKYNLENRVYLLGEQKNPHKFTKKCDVFVCSSLSEGYSTACTEAILLGIPVISTNVPGAEEIIRDAECGCVTENSYEGLVAVIEDVLKNKQQIYEWKEIIKRTRYKFELEYRKKRIEKLFNDL